MDDGIEETRRKSKMCIDLGERKGRHTFSVPHRQFQLIPGIRNKASGARKGPCDLKKVKRLGPRLRKERTFCFYKTKRRGKVRTVEVIAPRAASNWLKLQGAKMGKCKDSGEVDYYIQMELIE